MHILAERSFPSFFKGKSDRLLKFYSDWLDWTELRGNAQYILNSMATEQDIDESVDAYKTHLRSKLTADFPERTAVDLKLLLKTVLWLYRAKSSRKAYDFLFRVLFNSPARIWHPRETMLRTSDGTWDIPQYVGLDVSGMGADLQVFAGSHVGWKIEGESSGAVAFISGSTTYTGTSECLTSEIESIARVKLYENYGSRNARLILDVPDRQRPDVNDGIIGSIACDPLLKTFRIRLSRPATVPLTAVFTIDRTQRTAFFPAGRTEAILGGKDAADVSPLLYAYYGKKEEQQVNVPPLKPLLMQSRLLDGICLLVPDGNSWKPYEAQESLTAIIHSDTERTAVLAPDRQALVCDGVPVQDIRVEAARKVYNAAGETVLEEVLNPEGSIESDWSARLEWNGSGLDAALLKWVDGKWERTAVPASEDVPEGGRAEWTLSFEISGIPCTIVLQEGTSGRDIGYPFYAVDADVQIVSGYRGMDEDSSGRPRHLYDRDLCAPALDAEIFYDFDEGQYALRLVKSCANGSCVQTEAQGGLTAVFSFLDEDWVLDIPSGESVVHFTSAKLKHRVVYADIKPMFGIELDAVTRHFAPGERVFMMDPDTGEAAQTDICTDSYEGFIDPQTNRELDTGSGLVDIAPIVLWHSETDGHYTSSKGFISDINAIQDNHYWQTYSYVVQSYVGIKEWRRIVKRLLHPAGLIFFGEVLMEGDLEPGHGIMEMPAQDYLKKIRIFFRGMAAFAKQAILETQRKLASCRLAQTHSITSDLWLQWIDAKEAADERTELLRTLLYNETLSGEEQAEIAEAFPEYAYLVGRHIEENERRELEALLNTLETQKFLPWKEDLRDWFDIRPAEVERLLNANSVLLFRSDGTLIDPQMVDWVDFSFTGDIDAPFEFKGEIVSPKTSFIWGTTLHPDYPMVHGTVEGNEFAVPEDQEFIPKLHLIFVTSTQPTNGALVRVLNKGSDVLEFSDIARPDYADPAKVEDLYEYSLARRLNFHRTEADPNGIVEWSALVLDDFISTPSDGSLVFNSVSLLKVPDAWVEEDEENRKYLFYRNAWENEKGVAVSYSPFDFSYRIWFERDSLGILCRMTVFGSDSPEDIQCPLEGSGLALDKDSNGQPAVVRSSELIGRIESGFCGEVQEVYAATAEWRLHFADPNRQASWFTFKFPEVVGQERLLCFVNGLLSPEMHFNSETGKLSVDTVKDNSTISYRSDEWLIGELSLERFVLDEEGERILEGDGWQTEPVMVSISESESIPFGEVTLLDTLLFGSEMEAVSFGGMDEGTKVQDILACSISASLSHTEIYVLSPIEACRRLKYPWYAVPLESESGTVWPFTYDNARLFPFAAHGIDVTTRSTAEIVPDESGSIRSVTKEIVCTEGAESFVIEVPTLFGITVYVDGTRIWERDESGRTPSFEYRILRDGKIWKQVSSVSEKDIPSEGFLQYFIVFDCAEFADGETHTATVEWMTAKEARFVKAAQIRYHQIRRLGTDFERTIRLTSVALPQRQSETVDRILQTWWDHQIPESGPWWGEAPRRVHLDFAKNASWLASANASSTLLFEEDGTLADPSLFNWSRVSGEGGNELGVPQKWWTVPVLADLPKDEASVANGFIESAPELLKESGALVFVDGVKVPAVDVAVQDGGYAVDASLDGGRAEVFSLGESWLMTGNDGSAGYLCARRENSGWSVTALKNGAYEQLDSIEGEFAFDLAELVGISMGRATGAIWPEEGSGYSEIKGTTEIAWRLGDKRRFIDLPFLAEMNVYKPLDTLRLYAVQNSRPFGTVDRIADIDPRFLMVYIDGKYAPMASRKWRYLKGTFFVECEPQETVEVYIGNPLSYLMPDSCLAAPEEIGSLAFSNLRTNIVPRHMTTVIDHKTFRIETEILKEQSQVSWRKLMQAGLTGYARRNWIESFHIMQGFNFGAFKNLALSFRRTAALPEGMVIGQTEASFRRIVQDAGFSGFLNGRKVEIQNLVQNQSETLDDILYWKQMDPRTWAGIEDAGRYANSSSLMVFGADGRLVDPFRLDWHKKTFVPWATGDPVEILNLESFFCTGHIYYPAWIYDDTEDKSEHTALRPLGDGTFEGRYRDLVESNWNIVYVDGGVYEYEQWFRKQFIDLHTEEGVLLKEYPLEKHGEWLLLTDIPLDNVQNAEELGGSINAFQIEASRSCVRSVVLGSQNMELAVDVPSVLNAMVFVDGVKLRPDEWTQRVMLGENAVYAGTECTEEDIPSEGEVRQQAVLDSAVYGDSTEHVVTVYYPAPEYGSPLSEGNLCGLLYQNAKDVLWDSIWQSACAENGTENAQEALANLFECSGFLPVLSRWLSTDNGRTLADLYGVSQNPTAEEAARLAQTVRPEHLHGFLEGIREAASADELADLYQEWASADRIAPPLAEQFREYVRNRYLLFADGIQRNVTSDSDGRICIETAGGLVPAEAFTPEHFELYCIDLSNTELRSSRLRTSVPYQSLQFSNLRRFNLVEHRDIVSLFRMEQASEPAILKSRDSVQRREVKAMPRIGISGGRALRKDTYTVNNRDTLDNVFVRGSIPVRAFVNPSLYVERVTKISVVNMESLIWKAVGEGEDPYEVAWQALHSYPLLFDGEDGVEGEIVTGTEDIQYEIYENVTYISEYVPETWDIKVYATVRENPEYFYPSELIPASGWRYYSGWNPRLVLFNMEEGKDVYVVETLDRSMEGSIGNTDWVYWLEKEFNKKSTLVFDHNGFVMHPYGLEWCDGGFVWPHKGTWYAQPQEASFPAVVNELVPDNIKDALVMDLCLDDSVGYSGAVGLIADACLESDVATDPRTRFTRPWANIANRDRIYWEEGDFLFWNGWLRDDDVFDPDNCFVFVNGFKIPDGVWSWNETENLLTVPAEEYQMVTRLILERKERVLDEWIHEDEYMLNLIDPDERAVRDYQETAGGRVFVQTAWATWIDEDGFPHQGLKDEIPGNPYVLADHPDPREGIIWPVSRIRHRFYLDQIREQEGIINVPEYVGHSLAKYVQAFVDGVHAECEYGDGWLAVPGWENARTLEVYVFELNDGVWIDAFDASGATFDLNNIRDMKVC